LAVKGDVTFSMDGSPGQLHIAPLILIVFVENAFKHTQTSLLNNIHIKISVKIDNNTLYFYCENNYSEDSNAKVLANGIGLKNVKGRLDLNYKDRYKLNIERKNNWYKVFLKIELDNSNEQ
jgi:LytS/YehU family sensor histidine kinase